MMVPSRLESSFERGACSLQLRARLKSSGKCTKGVLNIRNVGLRSIRAALDTRTSGMLHHEREGPAEDSVIAAVTTSKVNMHAHLIGAGRVDPDEVEDLPPQSGVVGFPGRLPRRIAELKIEDAKGKVNQLISVSAVSAGDGATPHRVVQVKIAGQDGNRWERVSAIAKKANRSVSTGVVVDVEEGHCTLRGMQRHTSHIRVAQKVSANTRQTMCPPLVHIDSNTRGRTGPKNQEITMGGGVLIEITIDAFGASSPVRVRT